ncbi:MAG: hypothetical protein EXQ53_12460 [Acidobacteria bacterium]|nr:hypothetical protein [Acidobacteriota bacterium]
MKPIGLFGVVIVVLGAGCGGAGLPNPSPTPNPSPNPSPTLPTTGAERYVTVGFWTDPTCGGPPASTNRFPVHYGDSQCYTWPGRSGENSASRFSCGRDSFSYTQWTTLTCSGGQNPPGTRKTSTLTDCTQDVPPTLYARVVDFSGCAGAAP